MYCVVMITTNNDYYIINRNFMKGFMGRLLHIYTSNVQPPTFSANGFLDGFQSFIYLLTLYDHDTYLNFFLEYWIQCIAVHG